MRISTPFAAALACSTCIVAISTPAVAQERYFEIPAGDLKTALDVFARQSGNQVVYRVDQVRSSKSNGARGTMTPAIALDTLLTGSRFSQTLDSSGAIAIVPEKKERITKISNTVNLVSAQDEPPAAAPAQENRTGLEEIIVTARKREESLLDVPVAVTAIGGQEIARQAVGDLGGIAQLAPQLIISTTDAGTGATFAIRGVGSSPLDYGIEQSVSIVIDGVSITRGAIVKNGMFDLEQVEVMKGPQALFFGKNSPAGVIALTTANGTDTLQGHVKAGYEFEARERYLEAVISGPLSDTLKGRIAVRGTKMRGWFENVALPLAAAQNPLRPLTGSPGRRSEHGPGTEEIMGRATLNWSPSSDFDATLKVSMNRYKDLGTSIEAYCYDDTAPATQGNLDPFNDCKFDRKIANSGVAPSLIKDWPLMRDDGKTYSDVKTILSGLTMNYTLGNLTLTSVTGYMKVRRAQSNGQDYTSFGGINGSGGENTHSFAQELRAVSDFDAPVNFTMGGFYEEVDRRNQSNFMNAFLGVDPVTGKYHSFQQVGSNKAKTLSLFGQVRWNILDNLELSGGVRYTKEKRRQRIENTYVHPVAGPAFRMVPEGQIFRGNFSDTNYSPEITLSWKPEPGLLLYAAYKTGYKSGGFSNPGLFQLNPVTQKLPQEQDLAFAPEKAKGGEIGLKGKLFNNRVLIESAAYSYKYDGLQVSVFNAQTFGFFIKNAASARIKGAELNVIWQAAPGLRVNGGATYNSAKFLSFPGAQCYPLQPAPDCTGGTQDLAGARLPRAPEWTFTGGASYEGPLTSTLNIGLNADIYYVSSYVTADVQDPRTDQEGFVRVNGGLRVFTNDDRYELALIGRNLTNKLYREYTTLKAFGKLSGDFASTVPRGREVRLQGTFRF